MILLGMVNDFVVKDSDTLSKRLQQERTDHSRSRDYFGGMRQLNQYIWSNIWYKVEKDTNR